MTKFPVILFYILCLFLISCQENPSSKQSSSQNSPDTIAAANTPVNSAKIITVSILPQKYFVKRIAGDRFQINVMVGPGQSPANYEPLPTQMKNLTKSILYFRIGAPFEKSWIHKLQNANPKMTIIDTRKGLQLRQFDTFETNKHTEQDQTEHNNENDKHHDHENHIHEEADPHVWLSPKQVQIQANNIYQALINIDPDNKDIYQHNLKQFLNDLYQLGKNIAQAFAKVNVKEFMVFHPAWGYFADQFGLKQIPIEIEGKSPSPKQLIKMIDRAKAKNIKVIFVQKQFSDKSAKAIAEAIDGLVIAIDPLSDDYINNLNNIAQKIIDNIQ